MMNSKKILLIIGLIVSAILPASAQIQSGKAIQITIKGVPVEESAKIDGMYPVSQSGFVTMPMIGAVQAAGNSSESLARKIEAAYKSGKIYRNPTIQVIDSSAQEINQEVVHVGGLVGRPGPTPFTQGLTLYQAIQAAGGPTTFGSMYRVKVFRDGKQQQYDLTQAKYMEIKLQPGDTIEVPQKNLIGR
ncbi:polysaccharide biosynthesis/export family protein [Luteolibacter pohnpeiensis]|uniref:Polysaccharide biosynthesis/export family protein n=1 Tax=Luteolibacter pohnpeiensis TaxID=454153 RepID=A0A934S6C7_9BACT|nr:polysaccharide biosynthesis/export family protein [Luteolibacter pohnpeiensis]MBK1881596.1 polysaccharide biosynthesis/export family protein [Luteolibacter pohnpeiensis]